MQSGPAVTRPNLSESIAAAIRQRVVDSRVPPGVRINEVHLAAEMGRLEPLPSSIVRPLSLPRTSPTMWLRETEAK